MSAGGHATGLDRGGEGGIMTGRNALTCAQQGGAGRGGDKEEHTHMCTAG